VTVAGFELKVCLRRGEAGAVYQAVNMSAENMAADEEVALWFIPHAFLAAGSPTDQHPDRHAMLRREILAMQVTASHPRPHPNTSGVKKVRHLRNFRVCQTQQLLPSVLRDL
jgi:hypothetical protein